MTGLLAKKRISVFLTKRQTERLKALKLRDGVPEAVSIRKAIDDYLRKKRIAQKGDALDQGDA